MCLFKSNIKLHIDVFPSKRVFKGSAPMSNPCEKDKRSKRCEHFWAYCANICGRCLFGALPGLGQQNGTKPPIEIRIQMKTTSPCALRFHSNPPPTCSHCHLEQPKHAVWASPVSAGQMAADFRQMVSTTYNVMAHLPSSRRRAPFALKRHQRASSLPSYHLTALSRLSAPGNRPRPLSRFSCVCQDFPS